MRFFRRILQTVAVLALLGTGIVRADHPLPPVNLIQVTNDDGSLPIGGSTAGSSNPLSAILRASSDSGTCESKCEYTLGVEIVPVGQPFQNVPTQYVSMSEKADCEEIPYPDVLVTGLLPNTAYKWQCIEYTCSCPPPFVVVRNGESGCVIEAGIQGPGGPTWVQFNGGGVAFITGGNYPKKFQMGYVAATDQGVGQVFFYDKNPSPSAQSWKLEVRRTDQTTVFINTYILNKPGGPPPGDVTGFSVFELPRVDAGISSSFEIDVMYRVLVFSGLNATGPELYRSDFYFAQHPSSLPTPPFTGFGTPAGAGYQAVPYADLRPVGQNLMVNYEMYQKLTSGPQAMIRTNGHGIIGAFPTKHVHAPTILSPMATVFSGDSLFFIRSRRRYKMTTGSIIGNFDVAPKSPNSGFLVP